MVLDDFSFNDINSTGLGPDGVCFEIHGEIAEGNATIKYPLSQVGNLQQNTLQMHFWDGSAWNSCPGNETVEDGYLVCETDHFSTWAVSGEEEQTTTTGGGGGGGGGGSSSETYDILLTEETDESLGLEEDDEVDVEFNGTTYNFEATETGNNGNVLTYDDTDYEFTVAAEETFDLNGDGRDDLIITLDQADVFGATFTFEGIEEDTGEVQVVEQTQSDQTPEDTSTNEEESQTPQNQQQDEEPTSQTQQVSGAQGSEVATTSGADQPTPSAGLGGLLTADTPTVVGALIGLLVLLGLIGGGIYYRRTQMAKQQKK